MPNLENFNNIYANLAESAYNNRPTNFPYPQLKTSQRKDLDSGKSVKLDFSKSASDEGQVTKGGKGLDNDGKVFLQPDSSTPNTKKLERTETSVDGLNPSQHF
ncbi:MAG: hypothetical protein LBV19_10815 [Streptococcaceae bacterium]|jgi:hypothetical protein|nr:hypothetical protein [Streptococcaceae bacterium]